MSSWLRLGAQAVAVVLVAGLFTVLALRVIDQQSGDATEGLGSGKTPPAPAFALERLDGGGELSLASLRGRAVVVNFWASWCEPCREEAPLLERAWQRHRKRGLVVLGVDVRDFKGDARKFARKYGMTYPLVRDGSGETMDPYGVRGLPETFFVNRRGKLVGDKLSGGVDIPKNRERFNRYIELALTS